jgi:hypothetical protein
MQGISDMSEKKSQIWVDADACPNVIKEILFRAAQRVSMPLTLVANHRVSVPPSSLIRSIQVESGFDVADNYIVEQLEEGDLVISSDIPLAADAIAKGALVLSPRGERFTPNNIQQRLTMRNFMEEMRSAGEQTGGPAAMSQSDRQAFANELDRWLAVNA